MLGGLLAPCILTAGFQMVFGLQGKGAATREHPTYPFRELLATEDREEVDQEWNELLDSVDNLNESLNQ